MLPVEAATAVLEAEVKTLVDLGRKAAAEQVVEDTTNSSAYQSWSVVDRARLLNHYAETYQHVGMGDESMELDMRLLNDLLESVLRPGHKPDPDENKLLVGVSKSLLQNDDAQRWAKIYGVLERKSDAFFRKQNVYMHWSSQGAYFQPFSRDNPFEDKNNHYIFWVSMLKLEALWKMWLQKRWFEQDRFDDIDTACFQTMILARLCSEPALEERCFKLSEMALKSCVDAGHSNSFDHMHLARSLEERRLMARAEQECRIASSLATAGTEKQLYTTVADAVAIESKGELEKAAHTIEQGMDTYEKSEDSQIRVIDLCNRFYMTFLACHREIKGDQALEMRIQTLLNKARSKR
jgi:hypothetical protein